MPNFKCSIVIPHYNQVTQLKNCLDHILNTHNFMHEIIVADNGSVTGLEFLDNYPVKLIHADEVKSPYHARNKGIEIAEHDVIVLIDCNCKVPPDFFEKMFGCLKENTIIAPVVKAKPDHLDMWQKFDYLYSVPESFSKTPKALPAGVLMFYKEAFTKTGNFRNVRSLGDMEWTARAKKNKITLKYCIEASYYYPFKKEDAFLRKYQRLGAGMVENKNYTSFFIFFIKNLFPPSFNFLKSVVRKNIKYKTHLSYLQIFYLCYVVKLQYAIGGFRKKYLK